MTARALSLLIVPLVCGTLPGCALDRAPTGLRLTPPGDGPTVRFDRQARPLPDIPLPNDLATFADPTSRTGRRLDLGIVGSTRMERRAREDLATMEGWGVSSAITVAFERSPGTSAQDPALDLEAIASRMSDDEHDPGDDPFYVVNLATGIPVLLDVGSGVYPVSVRDPWRYGPIDPKASEPNIVFETVDESDGSPEVAYRPELDRDFDGVLDRPNALPSPAGGPAPKSPPPLLDWYERASDTLILRPLLPLEEKTEYAVVLTDRLKGPNGQPVRSSFEAIHHPAQRAGIARLRDWLSDERLASYYGDIAGTGLGRVAFAWTFTTQPTHEDLRLLRDGLYGRGPFARWQRDFEPNLVAARAVGPEKEPRPGWETSSQACAAIASRPFLTRPNDPVAKESLGFLFEQALGLDFAEAASFALVLEHIDHIVLGSFDSPYLLGSPADRDPDTHFRLDFRTGAGDVVRNEVPWLLVVPKAREGRRQPFPVAIWNHGLSGSALDALHVAGDYARQGIAVIAYNAPDHGFVVSDANRELADNLLAPSCLAPLAFTLTARGRARDLDGSGIQRSGSGFWTAHPLHSRDSIRQTVVDGLQLVRALRSLDGRIGSQDLTGDGKPDVAGDFDGDGVPDVGGPNVAYFTTGRSVGGIASQIQGAIEPRITAAAPIAGGGGLVNDIAFRSSELATSLTSQLLGPYVFAVPAVERPARGPSERIEQIGSRCTSSQRTLRIEGNDGARNRELEIACLDPSELAADMTVIVTNVSTGEARCARTDLDGRFRIPIPTTEGDALDVRIYTSPDVVPSFGDCRARPGSPVGRRVNTFEQAALGTWPVRFPEQQRCRVEAGCQQWQDDFFGVGSPLVAPNDGLGLRRQSPQLRQFRDLAQAAMDPADPSVFAPFYMLRPLADDSGGRSPPRALLAVNTIGDSVVPIAAGLSFARAAGALPFLPPSAVERLPAYAEYATPRELYERLGRRSPMKVLVDTGVVEGIARAGQWGAGPACRSNRDEIKLCQGAPTIEPWDCETALYDPDWISEGRMPFDQPHPDVPLRLARVAGTRVFDSTSLAAAWEPRLRGTPFGPDHASWTATGRVVGVLDHYVAPRGANGWVESNVCRTWDFATYGNRLIARFFASEGRDIYYLSHPKTHGCLADATCDFLK